MQAVGKIPCKNFLGTWLPLLLHRNEVNQPIKLILYLRKIIGFSADLLTAQLATGGWSRRISVVLQAGGCETRTGSTLYTTLHCLPACTVAQPQKDFEGCFSFQNTCSKLVIYCSGIWPGDHMPSQGPPHKIIQPHIPMFGEVASWANFTACYTYTHTYSTQYTVHF